MKLSTVAAFKHVTGGGHIEIVGDRLTELQHVLAMMLGDIDEVCRAEGIPYTLSGGTCLGAIRHQGFIPWDDDIDLNMTARSFERFSDALLRRYGDKYWVHRPGVTPGYELALPRVRLKGTTVRSKEDFGLDECGAYVDIFIINSAPDGALCRTIHGIGSMALGFAYSCRRFAEHSKEYLRLVEGDSAATRTFKIKILLGKLLRFRTISSWITHWLRWNAKYDSRETDFVSIPVGRAHYFGELQQRKTFFPVRDGVFCGLSVPLPGRADTYMQSLYGPNYMQLPPEGEREHHVVLEFDLGSYRRS